MPFAGDAAAARRAQAGLLELDTRPGDELILADNSGGAAVTDGRVILARAVGERSPAHARNVGAARARNQWILFLDADCRAPADLLDSYFRREVAEDVGALAGEVLPNPDATSLAARYGSARSFLSQAAHLAHPYLPRAVAANLLVRRAAFEDVGGFYERLRAAEDTDFSWRLQRAGWRLELRAEASVEHRYRTTVRDLRDQWRGYAAGRAWLRRRYPDFTPQPALRRALSRAVHGGRRRPSRSPSPTLPGARSPSASGALPGALESAQHLALDALLGVEELAGFALSNRASRPSGIGGPVEVVLVAERFPAPGDPLVDFARAIELARVEAASRPERVWLEAARELRVDYREDDGALARVRALGWLVTRHPFRCAADLLRRTRGAPPLREIAPAALRLAGDGRPRVQAVGGDEARGVAERLSRLTAVDPTGP
jgi:hypothetical protein